MIVGLVLIGLAFAWYAIACLEVKINIIQSIIFSIVGYFFSHVLFSSLFFFFDQYSIKRTVFLCMAFWGIISIIMFVKRKKFKVEFDVKNYVLPVIITLIGLPFLTFAPFEYFGMVKAN